MHGSGAAVAKQSAGGHATSMAGTSAAAPASAVTSASATALASKAVLALLPVLALGGSAPLVWGQEPDPDAHWLFLPLVMRCEFGYMAFTSYSDTDLDDGQITLVRSNGTGLVV